MLIEEIKRIKSDKRELRNFGLLVGGVFTGIGCVLFWFGKKSYPYIIAPGLALVILGLFSPMVLRPLQKVWMSLAVVMGWLMTRVILTLLFYLVITPIGLILRLSGKRPLDVAVDRHKESCWIRRKIGPFDKESYRKQF